LTGKGNDYMNDNNKTCTCPICNREVNPADGLTGDEQIIKGIIELYRDIQAKQECPNCPRCGQERMTGRDALSRQFGIHICDICGTDEAVRAMNSDVLPAEQWWIVQEIYKLREIKKTPQ